MLCVVQSREITPKNSIEATTDLPKAEAVIINNVVESDYYSEVDEEYEKTAQKVRTVENWIILGIYAISFIGSLVIAVILVHMKSRKASGLMYLM